MAGGDPTFLKQVKALEAYAPSDWWQRNHRTSRCQTSSEAFPESGLPMSLFHDSFANELGTYGVQDTLNVHGADASGESVCLSIPRAKPGTLHPRVRHTWRRVSAHLAAGLRLRAAIRTATILDNADAIFDADNHCVHAAENATEPALQKLLQKAAAAVDRARGECRSDAPVALDLWQGLFGGQWSIVETFDTDGRRFMVARQNDPAVASDRVLTRRERQVATLASAGCDDGLIAYSLGLAGSTVRTHLKRALAKLGLSHRANLVELALMLDAPDGPNEPLRKATQSGSKLRTSRA